MTIYKLTDLNGNSKSLYKPNLLINGDFKINIRNQTTYSADTIWTYTLPMWRINNGKLYVNEGFVRFHRETSTNNAYLNQVVATKSDSICVVKVKEISGNAVIRFGDSTVTKTVSDTGIYLVYNPQAISAVAIELPEQNSYIDIEYIDLFDGDIAYSHVEEDKAIAQTRVQEYVYKIPNALVGYGGQTGALWFSIPHLMNMKGIPTISTSSSATIVCEGKVTTVSNITLEYNSTYKTLYSSSYTGQNNFVSKVVALYFAEDILFSCEP